MLSKVRFNHMHDILDGKHEPPSVYGNILLVGTAHDGPTLMPRRIYSTREAIRHYKGGELVVGCAEAFIGGAHSVYAVRISGSPAETTLVNYDGHPVMKIRTVSSGAKYNDYKVVVDAYHIRILDEEDNVIGSYLKSEYATLGQLHDRIFLDGSLKMHYIIARNLDQTAPLSDIQEVTYEMSGGTDETQLSHAQRANKLNAVYDVIIDAMMDIDTIVLLRAYPDEHIGFCQALAEACHTRSSYGYGTIGIMGVSKFNASYILDSMKMRHGRYISIIAARPTLFINDLNPNDVNMIDQEHYISTGEALYAGLLSRIPIYQHVDNKPIPTLDDKHDVPQAQLTLLENKGFTILRRSTTRGFVVSKGVTLDLNPQFSYLYSTRLYIYIENMIRRKLDHYIGEARPQVYELESIIDEFMHTLVQASAIRMYNFNVGIRAHTIEIDIEFVPIHSIEVIHTSLRLITRR